MKSIRVRTPAKINLFLRVLGPRPDGYHDIETLFQAIDLHDEITIRETSGTDGLDVPGYPDLENEQNLVIRALRRVEKRTGRRLPVKIHIAKTIPVAGGLGGGSSDAAGMLLGIRALFDLELTDTDLHQMAAELGADVPFFLLGGSAVGEGIGERLTRVSVPLDYGLIVVNPGFAVSTARVYHEFGRTLTTRPRESRLWAVLSKFRNFEELLENDLEPVTEAIHPEIREMRKELEKAGVTKALMTGSGPTVFGIASRSKQELEKIQGKLGTKWSATVSKPWDRGPTLD